MGVLWQNYGISVLQAVFLTWGIFIISLLIKKIKILYNNRYELESHCLCKGSDTESDFCFFIEVWYHKLLCASLSLNCNQASSLQVLFLVPFSSKFFQQLIEQCSGPRTPVTVHYFFSGRSSKLLYYFPGAL